MMEINQTCGNNSIGEEAVVSNNVMYNSPFLVLNNNGKSALNFIPANMVNGGCNLVAVPTQNNQFQIQNIAPENQTLPDGKNQQQQQQQQQQQHIQVASLTPSQLQSLSYLLQSQLTPQFIQTSSGLVQIIPQINTATLNSQNSNHVDWQHSNNIQGQFTINNAQGTPIQISNVAAVPQLIPIQQIVTDNNGMYFTTSNSDSASNGGQVVSSIVDLNSLNNEQLNHLNTTTNSSNNNNNNTNLIDNTLQTTIDNINELNDSKKKPKRRRRKLKVNKELGNNETSTFPTSSNEITKEPAESSADNKQQQLTTDIQYDNKGRPFTFFCAVCPKKFTLNSRLTAHMRCHTGMRPYTCTTCGFSFTQKSYLIRHAAVHKEERPFHCEKCQKSYKHYGSLANHRKLHKKEKMYNNANLDTTPILYEQGGGVEDIEQDDHVYKTEDFDSTKYSLVHSTTTASNFSQIANDIAHFNITNGQLQQSGQPTTLIWSGATTMGGSEITNGATTSISTTTSTIANDINNSYVDNNHIDNNNVETLPIDEVIKPELN